MRVVLLMIVLLVAAISAGSRRAARTPDHDACKMGLLPILDVLPFYVAEQAGYFEEEGLNIELIPVSSALERDQLMLAGEIDGMLNDLISTGIFNQDEPLIQIVAHGPPRLSGQPAVPHPGRAAQQYHHSPKTSRTSRSASRKTR